MPAVVQHFFRASCTSLLRSNVDVSVSQRQHMLVDLSWPHDLHSLATPANCVAPQVLHLYQKSHEKAAAWLRCQHAPPVEAAGQVKKIGMHDDWQKLLNGRMEDMHSTKGHAECPEQQ